MAKKEKQPAPVNPNLYRRTQWRRVQSYAALFILLMLFGSMLMADIGYASRHLHVDMLRELSVFGMVAAIGLVIVLPAIFEADKVEVFEDKVWIKTIVFSSNLSWDSLIWLKSGPYIPYYLLKTKRCFFFINKQALPNHAQLAAIIASKIGNQDKIVEDKNKGAK